MSSVTMALSTNCFCLIEKMWFPAKRSKKRQSLTNVRRATTRLANHPGSIKLQ
jgi:hypothetical protein